MNAPTGLDFAAIPERIQIFMQEVEEQMRGMMGAQTTPLESVPDLEPEPIKANERRRQRHAPFHPRRWRC